MANTTGQGGDNFGARGSSISNTGFLSNPPFGGSGSSGLPAFRGVGGAENTFPAFRGGAGAGNAFGARGLPAFSLPVGQSVGNIGPLTRNAGGNLFGARGLPAFGSAPTFDQGSASSANFYGTRSQSVTPLFQQQQQQPQLVRVYITLVYITFVYIILIKCINFFPHVTGSVPAAIQPHRTAQPAAAI
jgi:hypothetical protein